MSTILRALKKAEQASMACDGVIAGNAGFKSRGQGDDKPDQRHQPRKRARLVGAAGAGLVLAAVVLCAVWPGNLFFLPGKSPVAVVKKEGKGPAPSVVPSPVATPLPQEKNLPVPKAVAQPDLPSSAVQTPVQPRTQELKNEPGPLAGQEHRPDTQTPDVKPFAPVLSHQPFDLELLPAPVERKTVPVKRAGAKDFLGKAAPAKANRASLAENADIQAIAPENLKLQALSWSKTPSARVAVINDRVLGEKDIIEGYEIVRINKNEIILSDGRGEKFRLVFKNR